jgi:hypothetical protein
MSDVDQQVSDQENTELARPVRTQWHRLLGKLLELLLAPVGITVQSEVQVTSDPPKVDIVLLRRSSGPWTAEQLRLLCDGLRDAVALHLLIEFKFSESFNAEALLQALSYGYFYRKAQSLPERAVQLFVMVARAPRTKLLQQYGYEETGVSGIYRSKYPLIEQVQVIVLNQLQFSEHNAFVQCFASQRRVRQSAFARLQHDEQTLSEALWELVLGLRGQFEQQGDVMSKMNLQEGLTPEMVMKLGREIRKAVIATLSPEDRKVVIASAPPEERLAGLAPEERLAGLAPDELSGLIEQIEAYLQQHGKPPPAEG